MFCTFWSFYKNIWNQKRVYIFPICIGRTENFKKFKLYSELMCINSYYYNELVKNNFETLKGTF